jgi:hypothetical protein
MIHFTLIIWRRCKVVPLRIVFIYFSGSFFLGFSPLEWYRQLGPFSVYTACLSPFKNSMLFICNVSGFSKIQVLLPVIYEPLLPYLHQNDLPWISCQVVEVNLRSLLEPRNNGINSEDGKLIVEDKGYVYSNLYHA